MTDKIIIADSGPLIALSVINHLELLKKMYTQVLVPPMVWEEVTVRGSGMPGSESVARSGWIVVQKPLPALIESLSIVVNCGEAGVLALAREINGSTALLDDSQARRVAERLNIPRIGTLGLLRLARKKNLVQRLYPLIEELQSHGIYMHQNLVNMILRDVGEW